MVFTDPGSVPFDWQPAGDEESGETDPLTDGEFPAAWQDKDIRFCKKCNQLKPPRCHHCSVCKLLLSLYLESVVSCGYFNE